MTTWTREDSARLDALIEQCYPNRTPLAVDPRMRELLQQPDAKPAGDRCAQCENLLHRGKTQPPPNHSRYAAHGLCFNCYRKRWRTDRTAAGQVAA